MKNKKDNNINLEDKILKKVYRLETRKTASFLFVRFSLGVLFFFLVYIFSLVTLDVLDEQQSFDLLFFFKDDFEVIKKYFFGNIAEFFQEMPQPLFSFLLISILLLLLVIIVLINNFKKIKNRLISIYKFYKIK